jgi:RNA polymerase sigma factor (sigma-70 family)
MIKPEDIATVYAMQGAKTLEGAAEVFMPRVERLARHLADLYGVEAQELVSASYVALWESLQRYDPARGELYRFVMTTVRHKLLDVVRQELPLDTRLWAKVQAMRKALADFEAEHGRMPSDAELAEKLGITRAQLDTLYEAESRLLGPVSVDAGDAGGIEHAPMDNPDRPLIVAEALATLPEREQKILYATYVGGYTTEEIASALGLEASWVRRLRGRALAKLRAYLLADAEDD